MANKFQRFLGDMARGFLAPKGNMADYQHAARLFTDDTFRLAPKNKFLFYVVFNINPDALNNQTFKDRHRLELNYLVKQADLPKYTLKTETLNQYNRKTTIYTAIQYDPVSLTLHDDNNGITNTLWALYYGYYFADRKNSSDPDSDISPVAYDRNPYYPKEMMPFRYGLDNDSDAPFFDSVQLVTMSRQRFFSYLLCNPKITKWDHDQVAYSDGAGVLENKMTLAYDAVIYNSGVVQPDDPAGFAVLHYDHMPSPIAGAEILQNGIAGIFGDLFSINALGGGAGGLIGGLAGGLVGGLVGGVVDGLTGGNQQPYGYGQPSFLGGIGLGSSSGFQQYGIGGGAAPLAALTVAGVGMAVNGLGNVISGVGSLFSSSSGSTKEEDPSKSVQAPNGEAPAAADAVQGPPWPPPNPGRGGVVEEPGARAAAQAAAANPDPPEPPRRPSPDQLNDSSLSTLSPESKAMADKYKGATVDGDGNTVPPPAEPSAGEQPAAPAEPQQQQGTYEYNPSTYASDVSGIDI